MKIGETYLVPFSLAALLVMAALLKAYELASSELPINGILQSRRLLTPLAVYEIALALWLVSGLTFIACFEVSLYEALSLRGDPRLAKRVRLDQSRATSDQVAEALSKATGLNIVISSGLSDDSDDLGEIRTGGVRAWALMEMLALRQAVPVRWDRTEDGYQLVRVARLGRCFPFVFSGLVLTLAAGYFLAVPAQKVAGATV